MAQGPQPISSIKHPAVAETRRAIGQLGKDQPTHFLVDGHKLVGQALAARAPVDKVFLLAADDCPADPELFQIARETGAECFALSKGIFFRLLGLGYETSVSVLATVRIAPRSPLELLASPLGDTCLSFGENIQDPRNVGVMIRNVDAAGLSGALFTNSSADPYSRGSVRSSTGSIFRAPLGLLDSDGVVLRQLKSEGVRLIGSSAHAATALWDADLTGPCALVFGNETGGLSAETEALCDTMITIPMPGAAHSFNVTVAHGIILCEAARQRRAATKSSTSRT
ncbi:TrmH family RNA methyltransferase [Candidatus Sumerlaeota bacterium]